MSDFDLDLRAVEDMMDDQEEAEGGVVLDVALLRDRPRPLAGRGRPVEHAQDDAEEGNVLVLAVEGDVNELAAGFAGEVREAGGDLVQFREFLVVSPPGVGIDRSRL